MRKITAWITAAAMVLGLSACAGGAAGSSDTAGSGSSTAAEETVSVKESDAQEETPKAPEEEGSSDGINAYVSDKEYIENALNLANNESQEWTYYAESDAWVLSVVPSVVYPEIEDQQGVSVCVPGAYVSGIDTDGDGKEDITSAVDPGAVNGSLVIDHTASVTSTNGQVYTADEAPVIINTGAAGYGSSTNTPASTSYAAEGYINVSCGNRGKQDTAVDENGNTYYTGDAPSCLTDQKNAARFVRYNILLGNLPGSVDYFVSTGGSGGGAHAVMFAATSDNPDFYNYQEDAGAVGVYLMEDGSFSTTVTIDGTDYEISDGAWGCIAYSAITSLYEADMAMAFEYYLDAGYGFGSEFQAKLAGYLASEYMDYINDQGLKAVESQVGFDLNGDGDMEDTIELSIEYDPEEYPGTNGYHGTYLDLYMAEFKENLQWYIDNLDYADGWTWFGMDGAALSDEEVSSMTKEDRAEAFITGRYTAPSKGIGFAGAGGMMPGIMAGMDLPDGGFQGAGAREGLVSEEMQQDGLPDMALAGGAVPEGNLAEGERPDNEPRGEKGDLPEEGDKPAGAVNAGPDGIDNSMVAENSRGDSMIVGTPDAGTTQAAGSSVDSANYQDYDEMLAAYEADIAELAEGDKYGNNLVDLYNPLNYIGENDTNDPAWVRILMGAAEGDMSMFTSLNLELNMLDAGIDAEIEWQWNGGHVPSEIFSESFALYVDQMYGEHVNGRTIEAQDAVPMTENGDSEEAGGTDISGWVDYTDISSVTFTLADAAAYRTAGASKAIPSFDVIDYGQEDYVFGNTEKDARHWDKFLLDVLKEHADELEPLFNTGN